VPEKRRRVPFETVREAPCATSSTSLQLRSMYADGQSFAYPLGRTATALGRNSRGRSRSVELLAVSRYVTSRHRIFLHRSLLQHQIILDNKIRLAEVYFFIHLRHDGAELGLALVSLYLTPDADLLCISHDTLWSCEYCYNASRRALESQRTKGTAEEEIRLYYV
jgi:hypothetical protein